MLSLWHRTKAEVNRLLGNAPTDTSTTHGSACNLPYEIVEAIITHFTHDLYTLKACSLTCRSWHAVAVPHLHHTITFKGCTPSVTRDKLTPLSKLHELGLIPHIKKIRVNQPWGIGWFVPQAFDHCDLHYFSAFTNVHTLELQKMELYRFIPDAKHYFGHFSPTLRSIVLSNLHCTPLQLSHFLSLFPNLDNIEIRRTYTHVPDTTVPDAELIPFYTPKPRGRLVLYDFNWVETWTRLAASCRALQFRHMVLSGSAICTPVLLEACAETLETLRISAVYDLVGK